MSASDISISTVSIGQGANIKLVRSIAEWGKGRAYYTDDPNSIPKIFIGETKIIRKKIITEKTMQPIVKSSNELLQGVEDLSSTTNGRVLSIDNIPADLFNDLSDTKESSIPLWPYLALLFLLLLIADVAVRKLLNVDGSISIQ